MPHADPEARRASRRAWYAANRERERERIAANQRRYRTKAHAAREAVARQALNDGPSGERWAQAAGFLMYAVSDQGRVRRLAVGKGTQPGRPLKPHRSRKGYLRVALHDGAPRGVGRHDVSVHRLVLDTFVGPRPEAEANHRNGVKDDNRLTNLEWVTAKENMAHAAANGLRPSLAGEQHPRARLTEAQVIEIIQLRGKVRQVDLAARFGVSKSLIGEIHRGRVWRHLRREAA